MTLDTVLLNGTVGVGKTTTAYAVGKLLARKKVPHAVIDLDEPRRMWPSPPGDRFHRALSMRNLTALAAGYQEAGAERLVLAGVVETHRDVSAIQEAVGGPLAVVRLVASGDITDDRLRGRHVRDEEGLSWSLKRRGELHAILDSAGLDDHVVPSDGRLPATLAEEVAELIGW